MRVGIIGGGLAGLTAGYRLAQRGHQVAVYERRHFWGGQAATFATAGDPLEAFYHHMFTSDGELLALLEELGLTSELEWLDSKVGFFHGGRIYPFVTALDLWRFSPLSLLNRIRLGVLSLYLQRQPHWRRFEGITAAEWIRRYGGERIFEVVWGPLLRGKFGQRYREVGMVWLWGKIFIRFASRGRGMQREKLGYLRGSFGRLVGALASAIEIRGGKVHRGSQVSRVVVEGGRVTGLELAGGPAEPCDAVVATVPSFAFLDMVPELPEDYASLLRKARYQAALVLVLTLKRSLSSIYWLNISDESIPFVLAVEQTNFIPPERYGGQRFLYLSSYLDPNDPRLGLSAPELFQLYLPHLKKLNPAFGEGWVEEIRLFKDESGQPVIVPLYSPQIPEHRTPIAGLYLANTTQIYPEDRGMNYSIGLGERVAELVGGGAHQAVDSALTRG